MTTRLTGAVAVAAVLIATGQGQVAAQPAPAQLTARSSEDVVAPGETVVLRGRFTIGDKPARDHVVKVQTGHVGAWQTLDGARVSTDRDGRYRVRVVLHTKGVRDLRVMGLVPGPGKAAFDRVTLMVKPGG